MHINKLTYQILTIFNAPKIHTNLLWDLTLLFLILGVLYFVSVFFFRNKTSRLFKKTKGKRQELAPVISNFLFHSPKDPKQEQKEYVELKIEIREYLTNKAYRKIISQILFDLQKDVAGGTRERLFKLYKELELHHDSFRKLKSWRWETVSQGILELSQMEVQESYQLIRKFINDRRPVVRKQAELATISLREDGMDYLLDTTKHSISEWQQIKLIETLGKRKNYSPPQFKAWLLSQNNDVVLFALRLIKHYNQKGAEPSITELIKHKNEEVKIAAIQCVIDFHFESALPVLKVIFNNSSTSVKIHVLSAIALLGSENDIPFLKEVVTMEKSFIIVSKANATINTISPETILPSKDITKIDIVDEPAGNTRKDAFDVEREVVGEKEEKITDLPESIEVEDIEFFDEMEIPVQIQDMSAEEAIAPAFELKPIEEDYGSSMDHLLGLVPTGKKDIDSNDFLGMYGKMPSSEKSKLVDIMGNAGDERELPLLEHITENETDSELRFQAFKTIQSIQKEASVNQLKEVSETTDSPKKLDSVFYDLYHHTEEIETKLILLKELIGMQDPRDIPFLKSLLHENDERIVNMAKKAMDILKQADNKVSTEHVIENSVDMAIDNNSNDEGPSDGQALVEEDNRIPMELFLLYEELGLEHSQKEKEEASLFDFELSEEFFLKAPKSVMNNPIDPNE